MYHYCPLCGKRMGARELRCWRCLPVREKAIVNPKKKAWQRREPLDEEKIHDINYQRMLLKRQIAISDATDWATENYIPIPRINTPQWAAVFRLWESRGLKESVDKYAK